MDYLVVAINMNWVWLGPWLVICFGIGVVAEIVELVKDECQCN